MEIDVGATGHLFSRSRMPKRKRSVSVFVGRKQRRIVRGTFRKPAVVIKPLAPPRTGGFYGLNQGSHGDELKTIDIAAGVFEFSSTGTITLINGIAQGTDFTNRVGRKFNMKSILIRGRISVGATPTGATWRLMLIYDKQTNGEAPVITDIIDAIGMSGVQNLSNRDRFVVIMDKAGWVEATTKITMPFKKYKRCNLEVINGGTGATVGSIQTGALWLISVGNLAAGATAPVGALTTRVRFKDP